MTPPRATMRLQFHRGFTFADAQPLVPYFARLGISHVYASPITTARPGSMHGYDVIDPTRVNPELGGEAGLKSFVTELRGAKLGLIVDIVPNHMAAVAENPWWFDVLRQGRESRYSSYFDIDWNAEDERLTGKVLLPVLGKSLRDALADGEIGLASDCDPPIATYFQHRFPISGDFSQDDDLAAVLARQNYRLASWRVANDEINWRRFFDINELAGLRMENPSAFDDVHALIFRLYEEGMIDGVRVDHVDGLADPQEYCRMLRDRLSALTPRRPATAALDRPYIVVEKILLRGETLSAFWQTDGTSGYDFMNEVSAVQHNASGEPALNRLWSTVSGRSADFDTEEVAARREIIARSFSAQLEACAGSFHRIARTKGDEISRAALRRGLIELLAHFPIYRTYATVDQRPDSDKPFLDAAVSAANKTCLSTDRDVVDWIGDQIGRRCDDPVIAQLQERAVVRFQQLSAPVAAKAVEDTAFYRYGRLLSRNDVGFDVRQLASSAADFHASMQRRQTSLPFAMLATATHDHKRGEDVRARLAVLSERADEWAQRLSRWLHHVRLDQPYAGDIAMLLQTIVGAWPLELSVTDEKGRHAFAERLAQWQEKALREAKLFTDWSAPDANYEQAARELVMSLIARNEHPLLLEEIAESVALIAPAGAVNGLAQALLKLTAPGIPDIYQGTELWDFSLVDPDNRRPVDFALRARPLQHDTNALVGTWRTGRIKQFMIEQVLSLRGQTPDLFTTGTYTPLTVVGEHADRIIAFERRLGRSTAVVAVPRIASRLLHEGQIAFNSAQWVNTAVALQQSEPLFDAFGSDDSPYAEARIPIAKLFQNLPFALLISQDLRRDQA